MLSTIRHISATDGAMTMVTAGLLPRAFRIVCAVFILSGVRNTVVDALNVGRIDDLGVQHQ
jgi:hypothetical protein